MLYPPSQENLCRPYPKSNPPAPTVRVLAGPLPPKAVPAPRRTPSSTASPAPPSSSLTIRIRLREVAGIFLAQFDPQSEIETSLVEQLVAARWRMERVWAIETSLLDLEMMKQEDAVDQKYESIDEVARTALAFRALCDNSRAFDLLSRYESQFRRAGERILDSLLHLRHRQLENKELQNEPNHPITRVPDLDDPQPPADFAPSNPIAPDLGDFTATMNLLPQASMNTPSSTSVESRAPRPRCRAGAPATADSSAGAGKEPGTGAGHSGLGRNGGLAGREQACPPRLVRGPLTVAAPLSV